MKPEYLMLAQTFKPGKFSIAGWYISEKLDGIRAYWDGGLSRGIEASKIPYANTVKDYRLKKIEIATGLWSRTGKVLHAPDNWLDMLPKMPLDGELWLGMNSFQELTSTVSRHKPDSRWLGVRYKVFDSPPYTQMLKDRTVKVRDYEFEIKGAMEVFHFKYYHLRETIRSASTKWNFEMIQDWLGRRAEGEVVDVHPQERLPCNYHKAMERIDEVLTSLLKKGAEGVMLRKAESFWIPQRCHTLLKHKPWKDDEAMIIGFTSGRVTERGSRLLGMIGALIVDYKGKRLELSGLTDEERQFDFGRKWAIENPGQDMPSGIEETKHFKVGQTITFKYRELSDDGVPKEARYYRKRGKL